MAKLTNEQRAELHIVARRVRIAYPKVFTPEADLNGKEVYSCQIRIFDEAEANKIAAALKAAAKYAWGDEAARHYADAMDSKNTRLLRKDEDGGYWYLNCKRQAKDGAPRVVGRARETLRQEDGKIYGGAYVNAVFDIWAYGGVAKGGTKIPYGFSATLLGIQFVEDGEPFGGSSQAKDTDFEELEAPKADDDFL